MNLLDLLRLNRRLLGVNNRQLLERFSLLRDIASTVLPEYRFKWPQIAWWENSRFTAYLKRFGEADGNNTDRRWAVYQLLRLTSRVEGDTVEVGVYQGAMSYIILCANERRKHHYIFDSFEGLSKPDLLDGDHWHAGDLTCGEAEVRKNLSSFDSHFTCYKGWVPHRFTEVDNMTFSFVHIDVDIYQPTRDSIAFFYPRTSTGGIVVCDDYGFSSCPGATQACDEFLSDKPEKMIALPDGGGFFIKGTTTAGEPGLVG